VVRTVPVLAAALVDAHVVRVLRRQAAEAVGRVEVGGAGVHEGLLLRIGQRAMRKRHGKNLVRAQARVVAVRSVDHIAEVPALGVPEAVEVGLHLLGPLGKRVGGLAQRLRE